MSLWKSGKLLLFDCFSFIFHFIIILFLIIVVLQEHLLANPTSYFTETGSFNAIVERIEVCDTAVIFHLLLMLLLLKKNLKKLFWIIVGMIIIFMKIFKLNLLMFQHMRFMKLFLILFQHR